MKLFGISGRIGAGKSTIAKHLEKNYGYKLLSFSTPLKEVASILFNIPLQNFYNSDLKIITDPYWNLTPRRILQIFGTECMRFNFGLDFWVRCMEKKIKEYDQSIISNGGKINPKVKIVIDDIRFIEESEMIKKYGGTLIKVTRPYNPYAFKGSHASENSILPYNITIGNKKDIDSLHIIIDQIIEDYL